MTQSIVCRYTLKGIKLRSIQLPNNSFFILIHPIRRGRMRAAESTQWLRAHAALVEEYSLVLSSHIW